MVVVVVGVNFLALLADPVIKWKNEFQFATDLLIDQRAKPATTQISVHINPIVKVHPSYNLGSILPRNKSSNVAFLLTHFCCGCSERSIII